MIIRCLSFAVIVSIVGCIHKKAALTPTTHSPIIEPSNGRAFGCWFVLSDGYGRQGYQAADFASSSATPKTQPLFKNLDELRVSLRRQGATVIDTIAGYTNGGWEIRGLTTDELRALK